ncbi:hypothetical protein EC968_006751 [Mortierella alpina]|nr:hypothetical protein EC968_006751 [Mortierella alpina]
MLKYGIKVAGVIMPSFSQLISPDVLGQTITSLKLLQESIVPGVDQVLNSMDTLAKDNENVMTGVTRQVEGKEALEGVELRKLGTFLQNNDENKVPGNLCRTVTSQGHVKWACIDHYRENYQATTATEFRATVDSVRGSFDENLGRVQVDLSSRAQAELFYSALEKATSVHELQIKLSWDTTYSDFKGLKDALRRTNVSVLDFDYYGTGPASDIVNRNRRYDPIVQIIGHPSIKSFSMASVHDDFLRRSSLGAAKTNCSNLKRLVMSGSDSYGLFVRFFMVHSPSLTILELPRNSIGDKEAQALSEVLKTNSNLVTLNVSTNKIGDNGVQTLAETLGTNRTLTTLNLRGNMIGGHGARAHKDIGAQALSKALETNKTLVTLNLRNNSIGSHGAQALAEALSTNMALTALGLQENEIGYRGMVALALTRKTISLGLSGNLITEHGAQVLSEAIMAFSTLTALDLGSKLIGFEGAQALAEALETNRTLTSLDLMSNYLGHHGARALAEALKNNKILTTLNLDQNRIGDNGAQALAEALKTNNTLITLGLMQNSIRDNGAQALAEALITNKSLITLDLDRNSFGGNGAQALAKALKTNKILTTLSLDQNSISDNGAQGLAEALKTNQALTTLDLTRNSIDDEAQALAKALRTNQTLKTLELAWNSFRDNGAEALAETLKTNTALTTLILSNNTIIRSETQELRPWPRR